MLESSRSEEKMTYQTLEELASKNLEAIKKREGRVYAVKHGGKTEYAFSNSPGQAALEVCEVTLCTRNQIQDALLNVLLEKSKGDDS